MGFIRLADLLEGKKDEQDATGATTTANIPTYPVPLGQPLRRPYPYMAGLKKKPVMMMTYAEYLNWLKKIRSKKNKKDEAPIWPSLLK